MSNVQNDIEEIGITIENARKRVKLLNHLITLRRNKDFIALIEEGYFKDESSRLVLLKSDKNMQEPLPQQEIDNAITGIGELFSWFNSIFVFGNQAKEAIDTDEKTLDGLLDASIDDEVA